MDKIKYDDFAKLDLRVGTVWDAQPHPNADRLVVLKVDLGEPEPRQIVAGIRQHYPPETLLNRQVVVLTNLESVDLRGVRSDGMLLAASEPDGSGVCLISPHRAVGNGGKVK